VVKVALLGAGGFVGGHTLRYLRTSGIATRAIVRRRESLVNDPDRRTADACDVYALRHAFEGCDAVVHAALGTNDEIVDSIAPVYAAAQAVGAKRLVYISSGSVHGQSPARGTDERSPLHVRHAFAYNNAKVRAERKLRRLRRRGTVELVILRPTIVFGPGSRWIFDFGDALRAGTAFVVDGAKGICNSIYVDNLGYAIALALTTSGIDGEVFLVSDRETVTWRDLFKAVADGLGYDIDSVPSLSPPTAHPSFKETYVQAVRTSEYTRWALKNTPPSLKATVRSALRRVLRRAPVRSDAVGNETQASRDSETASSPAVPIVSAEIAALQRCRWRLPNDKAVRLLRYDPPVTFGAGCQRSVEWLLGRNGSPT
jgi:nucleoside-diphosphate-sugar epimerase